MEPTKRCTKCGETLPIAEFHKDKRRPLGVNSQCKKCRRQITIKRHSTTKGAKLRRKSVKRYNRSDKRRAAIHSYSVRRREMQTLATPPWSPLHAIAAVYSEAERLTLESGIKHEVHHIMPIMEFEGLFVGLHVPWNLEILTAEEHIQAHIELRQAYHSDNLRAKKNASNPKP